MIASRARFAHIHFLTSNGLQAGTMEGLDSVVRLFDAILGNIDKDDRRAIGQSLKQRLERLSPLQAWSLAGGKAVARPPLGH